MPGNRTNPSQVDSWRGEAWVINLAAKKKNITDGGNDAREILERGSILLPPRDERVLVALVAL